MLQRQQFKFKGKEPQMISCAIGWAAPSFQIYLDVLYSYIAESNALGCCQTSESVLSCQYCLAVCNIDAHSLPIRPSKLTRKSFIYDVYIDISSGMAVCGDCPLMAAATSQHG